MFLWFLSQTPNLQNFRLMTLKKNLEVKLKFHSRPELFERLTKPDAGQAVQEALFRVENEDWYRHYYRVAANNAIGMVSEGLPANMEHRRKEVIGKLHAFLNEEVFFRTMCELAAAKGPLTVFCHGDCWTNNFLFRDGSIATSETEVIILLFKFN